jgi:kinesin family protein 2/24
MNSVTKLAIKDLYDQASSGRSGISFYISFFEIYGGKVLDLLNGRKKLSVLEDKYQRI